MNGIGKGVVVVTVLSLVAITVSAAGVFTNAGFESGDLTGWSNTGTAAATTSRPYGIGSSMSPKEGSYLGWVQAGSAYTYYKLWQTIPLGRKDKISGYAFFATYDYFPYLDQGQVYILSGDQTGSVVHTARNESVGTVGNFGTSGWKYWEYEVTTAGDYTVLGQVRNIRDSGVASYVGLDALEYERGLIEVTLDIKPGSDKNPVNSTSKGVIPVAVLGTADFDVTDIDVDTLAFGPGGAAETHGKGHIEDVNDDGYDDLVLHFDTQESGLTAGDTSATLTGENTDGVLIEGTDVVSVK
jgi:hypothetical protein